MFDYDPTQFAGMSKATLAKALRAEGNDVGGGYSALNKQPFVEKFLSSPGFKRIYSAKRLNEYREQNHCPSNDRMLETILWLTQNMLLGSKQDMESIAAGLERIQRHAGDVVKVG